MYAQSRPWIAAAVILAAIAAAPRALAQKDPALETPDAAVPEEAPTPASVTDPTAERGPDFNPASAVFLGGMPEKRPELALVLSGGGARGAAHIGVLKVLEEQQIVPDLIVGTSMGSIVGGLYAAGYSPDEIEEILGTVDWGQIFTDRVVREQKSYRRKRDDDVFLFPLHLRFQGLKPYLPVGLLGGQRLELLLRALTVSATDEHDFDDLPIPYRAVAVDIETGEAVVLGEGLLADAMRASMSIAGAYAPVEWDGRRLVDGGAVANLPIGIAQHLGARRVIAVDISSPLDESVEKKSFFGVMNQLSGMLTVGNRALDISRLREGDLLIRPDLGDITFASFDRMTDAVRIGENAAREKLDPLREFSSSSGDWSAFERNHVKRDFASIPLEEVRIENTSWVDDRIVDKALHVPTGVPLDYGALNDELMRLHGLEYFAKIREDFQEIDGAGVLTIETPSKPYARGSLQFGLGLESDLKGGATYSLTARHKMLAVNRRAGEWVNLLQLGSDIVAETQFYQPLDWKMRWFAMPALSYQRRRQVVWEDGVQLADYSLILQGGGLHFGRVLGNWGEIRARLYRWNSSASPRIGQPELPSADVDEGGVGLTFRVDTLDTRIFPTRGTSALVAIDRNLESFGSDTEATVARLHVNHAFSLGRSTIVLGAVASDHIDGSVGSVRNTMTLGGFLRLSGLGRNELLGGKGGLARAVYYYDLVRIRIGALANRVFVGASAEAGNTYALDDPITWSSLRYGGSLFVGAETVAGPVYFGWGWTEPDRDSWYFVIGQRF